MAFGLGLGKGLGRSPVFQPAEEDGGGGPTPPPSGLQARYLRFVALAPYWSTGNEDGWLVDEVEVFPVNSLDNVALNKAVVAGTGCIGFEEMAGQGEDVLR